MLKNFVKSVQHAHLASSRVIWIRNLVILHLKAQTQQGPRQRSTPDDWTCLAIQFLPRGRGWLARLMIDPIGHFFPTACPRSPKLTSHGVRWNSQSSHSCNLYWFTIRAVRVFIQLTYITQNEHVALLRNRRTFPELRTSVKDASSGNVRLSSVYDFLYDFRAFDGNGQQYKRRSHRRATYQTC